MEINFVVFDTVLLTFATFLREKDFRTCVKSFLNIKTNDYRVAMMPV